MAEEEEGCSACNGTGQVRCAGTCSDCGATCGKEVQCAKCGGSGEVEEEES